MPLDPLVVAWSSTFGLVVAPSTWQQPLPPHPAILALALPSLVRSLHCCLLCYNLGCRSGVASPDGRCREPVPIFVAVKEERGLRRLRQGPRSTCTPARRSLLQAFACIGACTCLSYPAKVVTWGSRTSCSTTRTSSGGSLMRIAFGIGMWAEARCSARGRRQTR